MTLELTKRVVQASILIGFHLLWQGCCLLSGLAFTSPHPYLPYPASLARPSADSTEGRAGKTNYEDLR